MPKLSIVIPVYNERETLAILFSRVRAVDLQEIGVDKEIVLVDDGSTDGTREIVRDLERKGDCRIVLHPGNQGKGFAVRTGLANATGDIVVIQDADLEYEPEDFRAMLKPILSGEADVVYGSRILGEAAFNTRRHSHVSFYLGGRFLSWLTNLLYGTAITDEPTCYKMFRRDLLERLPPLRCRGFEFCPEITARLALAGVRIAEVPIHYYPRSKSEGKKINWRDGVIAIQTLLRYRIWD